MSAERFQLLLSVDKMSLLRYNRFDKANERKAQKMKKDFSRHPLIIFFSYIMPHKKLFFIDIGCVVLMAVIDLVFPLVSKRSMEAFLPEKMFATFFTVMAIMIAAYIFKAFLTYVMTVVGHRMGCGLYKTKARDIVAMCKMLVEDYNGVLPDTVEELCKLPGVGRKSANLIVGDVYHKPAVVCDTHCIRITNLLGLTTTKDPLKTEKELRACLPMEEANNFCHRLVLHGRAVCVARRPQCDSCVLKPVCKFAEAKK